MRLEVDMSDICPRCNEREKERVYCRECKAEYQREWKKNNLHKKYIGKNTNRSKRFCQGRNSGKGDYIYHHDCVPGVNDRCMGCEHFEKDTTLNTMTYEDDIESRYNPQSYMSDMTGW